MNGRGKLERLLCEQLLIFDGAMGTMLQGLGLKGGDLAEKYNLERPEVIAGIHRAYVEAGAQAVTTNTFSANRFKLAGSGLDLAAVIKAAVEIARKAAADRLVALDVGPLGQLMEPYGTLSFETAYEAFAEQIRAGAAAGADLVLVETMSDLYEAKAAVLAARENTDLPVFCTMTFQANGRTLTGADPMTVVNVLQSLGVDALGINCSLGPEEVAPLMEAMLRYAQVPIMVQPNAGLPQLLGNETVFPVMPAEFAAYGCGMAAKGARILGGCCGTTPAHIEALKHALAGTKSVSITVPRLQMASSGRTTVTFEDEATLLCGRIHPGTDQQLADALCRGDLDYLIQEALDQQDDGAAILDVNVAVPGIDEKAAVVDVVKAIQGIVKLPLMISSSNPEVIEKAARIYNGRLIINTAGRDAPFLTAIKPIVRKYGCLAAAPDLTAVVPRLTKADIIDV